MTDETPHEDRERQEGRGLPTTNQPLHGRRRPLAVPLLLLAAFVLAVVLFYFFGLEVLVPAD